MFSEGVNEQSCTLLRKAGNDGRPAISVGGEGRGESLRRGAYDFGKVGALCLFRLTAKKLRKLSPTVSSSKLTYIILRAKRFFSTPKQRPLPRADGLCELYTRNASFKGTLAKGLKRGK